MDGKNTALFSHKSDEYGTPEWLFDLLDQEFHFNFDAACNHDNAKCGVCSGDSLDISWVHGAGTMSEGRVWLNPPYSKIAAFMKKAYEESQKGALVVCLIPVRSDTRYWHDYVMKAQEIRFVKGRLKFGDSATGAPFPSCVVIFRPPDRIVLQERPVFGKTIEQPKRNP
jgi:site-specific DNA-methyltransferase (adenine-specific)